MSSDSSKMKNLKALYEQRRERITSKITEINLTEYTIRQYQNLKNKYGISESVCIFLLTMFLSWGFLKNVSATLLLSSSIGFGFTSVYNAFRYKKMKKLVDENPDIDFQNYDFSSNQQELDKLFCELFSIDNYLLNPVEYDINCVVDDKDLVNVYKSKVDFDIFDCSLEYQGYVMVENKKNKVKKKGRR